MIVMEVVKEFAGGEAFIAQTYKVVGSLVPDFIDPDLIR
jgi:hypothetical protein